MIGNIDSFRGDYFFLSNFYPVNIWFDGAHYNSVEHAYQAAKTLDFDERQKIYVATNAAEAKKLGKTATLRPNWDNIKYGIMLEFVIQKFARGPLRKKLLDTGDLKLIEGNTWGDTYWGVCNGQGLNNLGRILEHVRKLIR